MKKIGQRVSLVLAFSLMVGCQQSVEMVPVTGTVIYQGKPLQYGSVMFQPVGVEGAVPARSPIAEDGTFALRTHKPGDGVVVGRSQVRITAYAAQKTNAQGNKHQELALGESAVPRRFQNFGTSGIQIDVTADMPLPLTIDLDAVD